MQKIGLAVFHNVTWYRNDFLTYMNASFEVMTTRAAGTSIGLHATVVIG